MYISLSAKYTYLATIISPHQPTPQQVKRQEESWVGKGGCSLDTTSANDFQSYLRRFNFQRQRFGLLYGRFEEDKDEPSIWFFDHIYHEQMFNMMRKINSREKIIGWYSTGPEIKQSDIQINEILRRYNTNPVFIVIRVQDETQIALPTEAYFTREETTSEGVI